MDDKVQTGKLGLVSLGAAFAVALASVSFAAQAGATVAAEENGDSEAAAPAAAPMDAGRMIFSDWSCGSCHVLKDGGGMGHVGPALDGNSALTRELVIARVSNGQGAMPGFAGALTDEEIATLADYIVAARIK